MKIRYDGDIEKTWNLVKNEMKQMLINQVPVFHVEISIPKSKKQRAGVWVLVNKIAKIWKQEEPRITERSVYDAFKIKSGLAEIVINGFGNKQYIYKSMADTGNMSKEEATLLIETILEFSIGKWTSGDIRYKDCCLIAKEELEILKR